MEKSLFHSGMGKSDRIMYTPAQFAKSSLIYLQETGELKSHKNHISRRGSLKSYLFFIVMDGTGKIKYKNQEYIAVKGDCVFLDCGSEYSHEALDNMWMLRWVHFYGENMAEIYRKYIHLGGKVCFKSRNFTEYASLLDEIYSTASSDTKIRDMIIYEKLVSLLSRLMNECFSGEKTENENTGARNLNPVKRYIDENYSSKITLDMLADNFFINKFYLTRLFKKQFGISVVGYILQVRITHAKQLLRFTDLSTEYIGTECGFSDVNYFARTFKKIEGVTPGQYRKMW